MPLTRLSLSASGDRAAIRKQVIQKFLEEEPGTGKRELCGKYHYEVETLADGKKVLLKRPASLNKGVDFTVHIEGARFRPRGLVDQPSHDNIFDDLAAKRAADPAEYQRVAVLIRRVFACEDVSDHELREPQFAVGLPVESILKVLKWLFIEQDVTYWNWSGRHMLYNGLIAMGLC